MMSPATSDCPTITVRIPITFKKRGGRKVITVADGGNYVAPSENRVDNTLLRALVKAFRWKQQLDTGMFVTVSELAAAQNLNISYVAHVLKLTLLSPALVEAILDGKQPKTMELQPLVRGLPNCWREQEAAFR